MDGCDGTGASVGGMMNAVSDVTRERVQRGGVFNLPGSCADPLGCIPPPDLRKLYRNDKRRNIGRVT